MIGTKINYTIDNFSGLINIEEYKEYETNNNKYHTTDNRRKKSWIDRNNSGVYLFYNDNKEVIYIGKTTNCLKQRIHHHIINGIKDYLLNIGDIEESFRLYKRNRYKYLSFIEVDKDDTHFVESYLINKYKPSYNIEFNKDFKYPIDFIVTRGITQEEFNDIYMNL
jgi:hypothetical protein|tara:strand:+ start:381 stop:878 length:498 start_codon:yes stop_codon:yes gene_type:complete